MVGICNRSGLPYNHTIFHLEVFDVNGFDFFSKDSDTKLRVKVFDMQDETDIMMYQRINQRCIIDKKDGWKIHDEDKYTDKHSNITILLKWEEPEVDYAKNEQRTS